MFQQPRQDITRVVAIRWFARGRVLVKDLSTGITTTLHGLLPGEIASLRLPASGKVRDGEILVIEKASPERATPTCARFDECSGCAIQHADDAAQSDYLRSTIREVLSRFAGAVLSNVDTEIVHSFRGSHRNRTRLLWRFDQDGQNSQLGLRSRRGDEVVSLGACPANHALLRLAVQTLENAAEDVLRSVGIHSSRAGSNPLDHAVIELAISSDDISNLLGHPEEQQVAHITLNLQLHPELSSHDHHPLQAALIRSLAHVMRPKGIEVSCRESQGWSEANPGARKALLEWVDDQLPRTTRTLLDPTCAAGGLSLALAIKRTGGITVAASDRNWNAVQEAAETAKAWKVPTALNARPPRKPTPERRRYELRGGDALAVMQNDLRAQKTYDAALINPMREPLGEAAMEALSQLVTHSIVYLAPAPQAGAKDVASLIARKWRIAACAATETHPWTARPMLALRLERTRAATNSN